MKRLTNVSRVDRARKIGFMKKTDEGYLTGEAAIAKVGVMTYLLKDGSTRDELINADELFNSDSLETLKMKPVTNNHPAEIFVDSKNANKIKVGFTGENIKRQDQDFLAVPLTLTDESVIKSVNRDRRELSPGYTCDLILQSGVFDGVKYDAIQTNRRYNHVAIVDRARGGSDLRLHLDSVDHLDGYEIDHNDADLTYAQTKALPDSAFCFVRGSGDDKVRKFPAHDAAHVRNGLARLPQSDLSSADKTKVLNCLKSRAKKYNIKVNDSLTIDNNISDDFYKLDGREFLTISKERLMNYRIDGIEYEAAPEVVNHISKLEAKIDESEKAINESKKNADKLQAELDTTKGKLDKLEKRDFDGDVKKAVQSRLSLVNDCIDHLDDETKKKVDSMLDVDIKKAVILKQFPEMKLDEKSDDYINAAFDSALVELNKSSDHKKDDAISRQRSKVNGENHKDNDNGERTQDQARADYAERLRNAWKGDKKDK